MVEASWKCYNGKMILISWGRDFMQYMCGLEGCDCTFLHLEDCLRHEAFEHDEDAELKGWLKG